MFLPEICLADRFTDLEKGMKAALREIVVEAKRDTPSHSEIELEIIRLDKRVGDMLFNLEHNLERCEKAPPAPDGSEALAALRALLGKHPTIEEIRKEKKENEECIEKRKKQIAKLKKILKLSRDVRDIQQKISWPTKLLLRFLEVATNPKKIPKDVAEAIENLVRYGIFETNGVQGTPSKLLDHKDMTKIAENELRVDYIRNRRKQYNDEKGESFDDYCIKEWEYKNNQKYNPKDFPGWKLDMLAWWKTSYILRHIEKDIEWVEFIKKDCEQQLLVLEEKDTKRDKDSNLLTLLEAVLAKTKNWQRFEKMEASIVVTVVDDQSSGDVANLALNITPTVQMSASSTQVFEFHDVPKGDYQVEVLAPKYVTQIQALSVTDCQVYALNIRLKQKPKIRIIQIINDDTNQPITDPIDVNIIDNSSGRQAGSATYRGRTLEFMVDPGSYEIRTDDPATQYELKAPVNINAEPGDVRDITLRLRPRSGFVFVVEVFDERSKLKIDPPPGKSPVPHVKLEPLDSQPNPSGPAYRGNGEIHFNYVHTGRYRYKANFCGWNFKEGTLNITTEDAGGPRVVKKIYLQPTSIDSYPVRVREHAGTTTHVHGFQASITGLGPRSGDSPGIVIGRDPSDPYYVPDFAGLKIQGPFYSGRYKLQITHPCYKPYVQDQWYTFCGGDPYTYKRQTIYVEPKPELVEARLLAKEIIKLTRSLKSTVRTLQDDLDRLKPKRAQLQSEISRFKEAYSGKKLRQQQRKEAEAKLTDLQAKINRHTAKVHEFEALLAKYVEAKKKREELKEKLHALGAVNCLKNDTLLKDQLPLITEETPAFPEDAAKSLKPALVPPSLDPNTLEFEQCETLIKEVDGLLATDVFGAQKLLNREKANCLGLSSEIDNSIAGLVEKIEQLITKQFAEILALLSACEFEDAKQSIAKMPPGSLRSQAQAQYQNALQAEEKFSGFLKQAAATSKDCRYNQALKELNDSKRHAVCESSLNTLSQEISKVRAARDYEKHTQDLFRQAKGEYQRCNYQRALDKLSEARDYTHCERFHKSLTTKLSIVEKAAAREKRTKSLYKGAYTNFENCQLSQALEKLNKALNHTRCEKYRSKIKSRFSKIKGAEPDLERVRNFFEEAKADYADCDYDSALGRLDNALTFAPCGRYRDKLLEKISKVRSAKDREKKTSALFTEANAAYKRCDYSGALSKLKQALSNSRCNRHKTSLRDKITKVRASQRDDDKANSVFAQAKGLSARGKDEQALGKLRQARDKSRCQETREQISAKIDEMTGGGFFARMTEPKSPESEPTSTPASRREEPRRHSGKAVGKMLADWWYHCGDPNVIPPISGTFDLDFHQDGTYSGSFYSNDLGVSHPLSGKLGPNGYFEIKEVDEEVPDSFWEVTGRVHAGRRSGTVEGGGVIRSHTAITQEGRVVSYMKCNGKWKSK